MTTAYQYAGSELELFAHAHNWKRYFRQCIKQYFGDNVLEVGAGIGGTTRLLYSGGQQRWLCLEPDARLAEKFRNAQSAGDLPPGCEIVVGSIADLPADARFDTLLYIDVLEHIEDDRAELLRASDQLRPGGRLIVLSPAHQWLYTPFDRAIGHFRRYSRKTLSALTPPSLELDRVFYLDSVGMLASLGNRLLLNSAAPTRRQIAFWDNVLAPMSRFVDPLLGHRVGKSIVGIWRKSE